MKAEADGPAMEEINRMIANGESSNKTIFTVIKKKKFWIRLSTSLTLFAVISVSRVKAYYLLSHSPLLMVCRKRLEWLGSQQQYK